MPRLPWQSSVMRSVQSQGMSSQRGGVFYGWWIVFASDVGLVWGPAITVCCFGVFLKPPMRDFHSGRAAVSLAFTLHYVGTHQASGLGIYSNFDLGINIIEDNAMTVPTTPGVTVDDVGSVFLSGSGQITHVIDGVGTTVNSGNAGTLSPVVTYP